MRFPLPLLLLLAGFATAQPSDTTKRRLALVDPIIEAEFPSLDAIYKDFHRNPELSMQEVRTAGIMAKELKALGFAVTEKVGTTGVVGVLKNGQGPTVLVRADMDALPVTEATALPYASKVIARDKAGREVGVMHACGHDIHMSSQLGTARALVKLKDQWKGTLVFICQPGEEIGTGARLMLEDGLFEKFPKPDYCLALHCDPTIETGAVHYSEGLAMANVDTVEITINGKGGHGAAPHVTVDPIVLAARVILDLQTIVSREMSPTDPAVVTVGSIHGGTKSNIIPNDVKMQLTVRSTNDKARKHILDAIERICKAAAVGARAPEPVITLLPNEFTPALYNDKKLTKKTCELFREILGDANVRERLPLMGGEDFSRYALKGQIPIFMYFLGTADKARYEAAKQPGGRPMPGMHSDSYYPEPAAIKVGTRTMTLAVLDLMQAK